MDSGLGKILVVDDIGLNRAMFSRRLDSRGFRTKTAATGYQALQILESEPFDVVLLDILLPDLDGYQVLRKIREQYSSSQVAVIMVTAKDQSEDIVRALHEGADDYVTKPIDFPVVVARINIQLSRKATEEALRQSEERYALAASGANDGLWDWDIKNKTIYFSDRWKAMLGYQSDEIGQSEDEWFRRLHPDDLERLKKRLKEHLDGVSSHFECEHRMILKDGSVCWMLTRGMAVLDQGREPARMVGWQTDITGRGERDILTSLPNRTLFLGRLSTLMARAVRRPGYWFAVLSLGLDRFRVINESLGHETGDKLLYGVARRLEQYLRPGDTLARLGGDEFAILVDDIVTPTSIGKIAKRFKGILEGAFYPDEQETYVTASIGIAMNDRGINQPEELLQKAQAAMYRAKNQGRNCFEVFDPDMNERLVTDLRTEVKLRHALENNELHLRYQPQYDLRTGTIVGVEALLRWKPNGGDWVSPGAFIPLAEDTGLIIPIGSWVIRTACRQGVEWQKLNLGPIRMAVNISSRQFNQSNLIRIVREALDETGLDPHLLDLELTESLLMDNVDHAINDLKALKSLGVRISIDDFGTGYSSLSYLKRFPIDTLKVDQSFIRDVPGDADSAAIATAIVRMAHSLKMRVVAEGVETQEHLDFLKALRCDEVQGFLLSKPISAEEFVALYKREMLEAGC